MNLTELMEESHKLEEVASKIQGEKQPDLSDEEIRAFVDRYQDWYTDSLTILPTDLKNRFAKEYEGTWYYPKIRGFLEGPTKPNVLRSDDPQTAKLFSLWQYPFERFFHAPMLAQRQILLEAYKRQPQITPATQPVDIEDEIAEKTELLNEYQDEREHLRDLKKEYLAYLRKTEIKAAKFGLSVPTHIESEIDEIKDKIKDLDKALEENKDKIMRIKDDIRQLKDKKIN
jgi:DNA repair exonuclease SbcCD ATPase subunit